MDPSNADPTEETELQDSDLLPENQAPETLEPEDNLDLPTPDADGSNVEPPPVLSDRDTSETQEESLFDLPDELPILPLRGVVFYPYDGPAADGRAASLCAAGRGRGPDGAADHWPGGLQGPRDRGAQDRTRSIGSARR